MWVSGCKGGCIGGQTIVLAQVWRCGGAVLMVVGLIQVARVFMGLVLAWSLVLWVMSLLQFLSGCSYISEGGKKEKEWARKGPV